MAEQVSQHEYVKVATNYNEVDESYDTEYLPMVRFNLNINFVKATKSAKVPTKSHDGDAGYDLYSAEYHKLYPLERKVISTGLKIRIPYGYYGRIAPRSGLAVKKGIDVLAGVCDSIYRGIVGVVLINLNDPARMSSNSIIEIKPGDKIAQIIFERCHNADWREVDELDETDRGEGGFGSTGN